MRDKHEEGWAVVDMASRTKKYYIGCSEGGLPRMCADVRKAVLYRDQCTATTQCPAMRHGCILAAAEHVRREVPA